MQVFLAAKDAGTGGTAETTAVLSLDQSILVRPIGSTIYIMPPYIISDDEIIHLSKGIQASLNATLSGNH